MSRPPFLERLRRKLAKTAAAQLFIDQWIILAGTGLSHRSLDWRSLHPLIPPRDRYWADPFVVRRGECYYLFIEEKLYARGLGRITCLTLDRQGGLLSRQVALERPYHLSYPFLFEHGGELFMIPESAAHRTVELYRSVHFPDRWEFVQNLLTNIYAVDTTHLEYGGRHWLFTNVKAPGGSSLDSLHLYSAPDLFADGWQPHPRNPVVLGIGSARPGGRIFLQDGSLIRPSQDSSRLYGYALKFNRITTLNETDYAEVAEGSFTPAGSPYRATHTFNQAGDFVVLDAILRRRK